MSQGSNAATSSAPMLVSAADAAAAVTKAIKRKGEQDYPKHIWYFVACTIFVAVLLNLLSVVWAFKRRRSLKRQERGSPSPSASNGTVSLWRLPQAVLTASRILAFRWRIPTVNMYLIEIFLTTVYLMALLIWEFVNTQNLTLKLFANRAGHIAASQFPLIVVLSAKNNAIEVLTSVSHEKLNLMHRTVSRAVLVIVWVHWYTRIGIDAPALITAAWRRLGVASGVLYTAMTLISIAPIRKRFYEFFFMTHLIIVFAFLITSYLHVSNPGFGYYIWPTWVVWGFDRVCRWLRYLILSNFHAPHKSPAELELVNHDAIRVTVRRWVPFGWRAGQHMFVALPTVGPIESHPFTIATLPEGEGKEMELVFVMRVRDGFTRRLRDYVQDKDGMCRAPVFLDGPYGTPPDITPFDTCVFVAGGSGVTYTLSRFRELVNAVAHQQACARHIVWVWAVRHQSHTNWFSSELAKAVSSAPDGLKLTVLIHVVSDSASGAQSLDDGDSGISKSSRKDVEKEGEYDDKASTDVSSQALDALAALKGVAMFTGRPDLRKILENAVTSSEGPVSVDVSGPESLVSDIRSILSSSFASPMAVLKGTPTIQLNVESFTM